MSTLTLSSIGGNSRVQFNSSGTSGAVGRRDRDGDNDGGPRAPGRSGMANLANAVTQSLSALGLGQAGQIAVTAPNAPPETSGDNTNTSTGDVGQALNSFMHSLMQALGSPGAAGQMPPPRGKSDRDGDNDGTTQAGPPAAKGYGKDIVSRLQSLVQTLSSGSTGAGQSATTTDTGALKASFENLVQALGQNASSQNTTNLPSKVSLQSFLENLVTNLQNGGGTTSTKGNTINTVAA